MMVQNRMRMMRIVMTKTDLDEKANTRRPHASPDQQYDGVVSSMIGWLIV